MRLASGDFGSCQYEGSGLLMGGPTGIAARASMVGYDRFGDVSPSHSVIYRTKIGSERFCSLTCSPGVVVSSASLREIARPRLYMPDMA